MQLSSTVTAELTPAEAERRRATYKIEVLKRHLWFLRVIFRVGEGAVCLVFDAIGPFLMIGA